MEDIFYSHSDRLRSSQLVSRITNFSARFESITKLFANLQDLTTTMATFLTEMLCLAFDKPYFGTTGFIDCYLLFDHSYYKELVGKPGKLQRN